VVKDESISSPDYAIDGGAGGEIVFAIVKSGTTSEQFDCVPSNIALTALLEIQTPLIDQMLEHCYDFFTGSSGDGLVLRTIPALANRPTRNRWLLEIHCAAVS
jgi:hypothetical protein